MRAIVDRGHRARLLLASAALGASMLAASHVRAQDRDFLCSAVESGLVVGKRAHVQCNPGDALPGSTTVVSFFAIDIGNPDASRVLSLAATAVVSRRQLRISYDPLDVSGDHPLGCLQGNCRLIKEFFLEQN